MKLYLSSYQIGSAADSLGLLFGEKKRIGVIRNALDYSTDIERLQRGKEFEFSQLESVGLIPEEIDLRNYFNNQVDLAARIEEIDGLWVVGGNTFILRKAMKQSGLDAILLNKVRDPDFVYAGYSAGVCVVTPTLKGIHLADEPELVPQSYDSETIWDGLGLVPFCIAPHYRSDHPESQMIELCVEYFIEHKLPFVALRDGDVFITKIESLPEAYAKQQSKS